MSRNLFWKLLEPEHPAAQGFCRKLTGNVEDGDDLYQDTLLLAMRRFESLREAESFRPWLYRIIVNQYKNRVRSRWWRRRCELTDEILRTRVGNDPSGQHTARRWLEVAFAALKPEDKALVTLYELEGWPVADVAGLYGKPEGTIKTRLSRARGKMRRAIECYLSQNETYEPVRKTGYALSQSEAQTE